MSKSFYDLVAFQRAVDLIIEVYAVTAAFPKAELYGLTSQMRRAAVGVSSQIAEGQGRLSFGEWRQFLSQARGSLFEVEAEALLAHRLGFLDEQQRERIARGVQRTGKALIGLIDWVQQRERETRQPRNRATAQPDYRSAAMSFAMSSATSASNVIRSPVRG